MGHQTTASSACKALSLTSQAVMHYTVLLLSKHHTQGSRRINRTAVHTHTETSIGIMA
jgi:hypothetical protein